MWYNFSEHLNLQKDIFTQTYQQYTDLTVHLPLSYSHNSVPVNKPVHTQYAHVKEHSEQRENTQDTSLLALSHQYGETHGTHTWNASRQRQDANDKLSFVLHQE
jgi:hypothetical protein